MKNYGLHRFKVAFSECKTEQKKKHLLTQFKRGMEEFAGRQQTMPKEFADIVEKSFWDMI